MYVCLYLCIYVCTYNILTWNTVALECAGSIHTNTVNTGTAITFVHINLTMHAASPLRALAFVVMSPETLLNIDALRPFCTLVARTSIQLLTVTTCVAMATATGVVALQGDGENIQET